MNKAVIFDIDGTLADNAKRRRILEKDSNNWNDFFKNMEQDTPIGAVIELYNLIKDSQEYQIVVVTGRPDRYRSITESWLKTNNIKYNELLMRKDGDTRPDSVIKNEFLSYLTRKYHISFVFDDRKSVVDMWRDNNIFCFQCQDHNF